MVMSSKKNRNVEQLKAMLKTPTNNFGLAQLFKNFVLIGEQQQIEEVLYFNYPFSATSWQSSLPMNFKKASNKATKSKKQPHICRTFNQYLRLVKRIAYHSPIIYIADTFYKLLNTYAVSCLLTRQQFETISLVNIEEDPISTFFELSQCPKVLNVPIDLNFSTGEVVRATTNHNLESIFDDYD